MTLLMGLLVGYVLARLILVVLALVAAIPGLGALLHAIKAAGLSPEVVFPIFINYVPTVLTAFAVGSITYRALGGFRAGLFLALAAPWFLTAGYGCIELADESLLDCWNYSGKIISFLLQCSLVPVGLLLAGLARRPPGPGKAEDADAHERSPGSPASIPS